MCLNKNSSEFKSWIKALGIVSLLALSNVALAATASSDFDTLYTRLVAWTTGSLGKSIAIIFLLVGLGMGVIRGSIVGAVTCIAAALALVIAPDVISTLFSVAS